MRRRAILIGVKRQVDESKWGFFCFLSPTVCVSVRQTSKVALRKWGGAFFGVHREAEEETADSLGHKLKKKTKTKQVCWGAKKLIKPVQEKAPAPRSRLSGFEMFTRQLAHPSVLMSRYLTADAFYSGSDAAAACLRLQQTPLFSLFSFREGKSDTRHPVKAEALLKSQVWRRR